MYILRAAGMMPCGPEECRADQQIHTSITVAPVSSHLPLAMLMACACAAPGLGLDEETSICDPQTCMGSEA